MNLKQTLISLGTILVKVVVAYFIIINVIKFVGASYNFGYRVFTEEAVSAKPGTMYSITINEETTPKQLANSLEEYGLIRDAKLFYVQYMLSEYKDKLVPGVYQLTTAETAEEMLAILSNQAPSAEGNAEGNIEEE